MPDHLTLGPVQVPVPDDGTVVRYSEGAVQDVLDFFSLLCFAQNEWAGTPFQILPWELEAIQNFYGIQTEDEDGQWVRYRRFLYDEMPKKNGKTEFGAGLGLYHLLWDGEKKPKVGIFSSDKENAAQVYDAAKYMVDNTCLGQPEHDPIAWAVDSRREIHTKYGGVMKVYSADAVSKHGYSFSAIIFDELHAQPNRRLWDILTAGSDAARRQQAVIVLTTAGDDPDRKSIGWEVHERCRRILAWRRGAPERELDMDDPAWCPIMYGVSVLTQDDPDRIAALDIWDEEIWKACNPGLSHNLSLRKFRAEARAAKQSEALERLFRWLRLNQWISTKAVGWLPFGLYDKSQWNLDSWQGLSVIAKRNAARDYLAGKRCFGGLDLSTTTDLTALTLIFPPQDGLDHFVTLFWAWRPEDGVADAEQRDHVPYRDWARAEFLTLCPGDMVDFSMVEDTILWCSQMFRLETLGVDPYLSRTITSRLTEQQINVLEIPQDMRNMSPAMKELERMIRSHEMLHEHNTAARWCFGNVRCFVDGNENMKPMKNRSIGRIDMVVAWIIAVAVYLLQSNQKPDLSTAMEQPGFTF
nr:MAG TPA: Large Terminase [Caudoviricetes sp.]